MTNQALDDGFVRSCPANTGSTPTLRHYKEHMVLVVVAFSWLLLAVGLALVVGSGIRMANQQAPCTDHLIGMPAELTVEDILGTRTAQHSH